MTRIKPSPVERLMAAMDRCAIARAEAQWMNGYRTGRGKSLAEPDATRMHAKEIAQWGLSARADRAFRKLAQRVLRESQP